MLSVPTDPVDLEERRKTLWAAYNLSCSVGISTGWNVGGLIDYREVRLNMSGNPAVGNLGWQVVRLTVHWVLDYYLPTIRRG